MRGSKLLIRVICWRKTRIQKNWLMRRCFWRCASCLPHADRPRNSANWRHAAPNHIQVLFVRHLSRGWRTVQRWALLRRCCSSLGMPPMYPVAIAMWRAADHYGLVIGLVYRRMAQRGAAGVYAALLPTMAAGRACLRAWLRVVLLGF